VEELEGQLLEREERLLEGEELDNITLCRELEVLSTRKCWSGKSWTTSRSVVSLRS
jgi:hypothetical protein